MAARPLAGLRGGRRVLGAGRDGQGPGRRSWSPTRRRSPTAKLVRGGRGAGLGRAGSRRGWCGTCGRLVGLEAAARPAGSSGQVEAFAAWRRFFEALAEDGPTVLVFEDIHWADDALLDFIDLLADRAGAVPLLIVCTARPELFERRAALGWRQDERQHALAHRALRRGHRPAGRGAARPGAAAGRGAAGAARAVRGQPAVRAGVRADAARPWPARSNGEGGWTLTGEVDDLPESIQGIIAARLDTLTSEREGVHPGRRR